ncbi:MAG: RidA family protein [Pirellulales bacterium]|nr:RidA family protein [Pirellulales bacterium]
MSPNASLARKLAELNLTLPAAPEPKGAYRPLQVSGKMAYASGHLPIRSDGSLITGRLGEDLDVPAGYDAARWAGLGILATLKKTLGSLDGVRQVVKILGVVNCTPDFTQQPAVVNGCSELFAAVFGPDRGIGARSAIGANTLPLGVPVEVEAIFEIE